MFQHMQQYRKQLVNYLLEMNQNIDWDSFINKNMALEPERMLNKIKSLIWVDKNLDYDNNQHHNLKLFNHYTSLLSKYTSILYNENYKLYILDVAPDDKLCSPLDDFIITNIRAKINILTRMLKLMSINFTLIKSSIPSDAKIVIPTGSITYKNPNELFASFNGFMIADNYNNFFINESDNELNYFKLSVFQLSKNPDISISEILQQQYGFLKFKTNLSEN